jgi:biopolymer transport protein ExbD
MSMVRVIWKQGGTEVSRQVMPDNVAAEFGPLLTTARAADPSARVIVKMDKDASYGIMADMMRGLQQANAPRFNVMTDLEGKGKGLLGTAPKK